MAALLVAAAAIVAAAVAVRSTRRARETSRRSESQFTALTDAAGFGVLILGGDDRIGYANAAAIEILGYPADRLLGQHQHSLLHSIHVEGHDEPCPLQAALAEGRRYFGRDHLVGADGDPLPVTLSSAPLPGGDGAALVFRDRSAEVVEERRREEAFALISHEIRSPLTTIVGFSSRLHRAVEAGRLEVSEQYAEEIALLAKEAVRMRDTVTVVLDVATLERRIDLQPEPIAVGHLVTDETDRAARDHQGAAFVCTGGEGLTVESDERYVRRILHNLLENAVKYGGTDAPVQVTVTAAQGGCAVSVADRGPGIPLDAQPQIFQRFYRQETTAGQRPGLGLGLYLSRRLARQLGGRLEFVSAPGEGATFTLWLPATLGEQPAAPQDNTTLRW
ncbi:MAG: PAS domain-containing sensor histidine kinase [Dehalococcoidia bacterium]